MVIVAAGGTQQESVETVWGLARPILGQILAEAALSAVEAGRLVMVRRDEGQLIITASEAALQRKEVAEPINCS